MASLISRRLLPLLLSLAYLLPAVTALISPLRHRQLIEYPDDLVITPTQQGIHDGYYYTWWTDGVHNATYTNEPGGQYTVAWKRGEAGGNFIGGKGWEGGGNRTIKYSSDFQVDTNGYLAIYGYTRNPLTEWYILEYWGTYNPAVSATKMGSVSCDGGEYDIYRRKPYQQIPPGVNGPMRFYSIRREKRTGGIVTTGCHFGAWEKLQMKLGTHQYQVVAVEGYHSSGNATVRIETPP